MITRTDFVLGEYGTPIFDADLETGADRIVTFNPIGGSVYLNVWNGQGSSTSIQLSRADLLEALKQELGLVHPWEIQAASTDWDAEFARFVEPTRRDV